MFISTIIGRLLQGIEFFRSGVGRWFTLIFDKVIHYKIFVIPLFIWGVIRLVIGLFGSACSSIRTYFNSVNFSGIQVGGQSILALANTVFPVDEFVGLLVAWFGLYAACASIRFIRAAWSAIPLKSS